MPTSRCMRGRCSFRCANAAFAQDSRVNAAFAQRGGGGGQRSERAQPARRAQSGRSVKARARGAQVAPTARAVAARRDVEQLVRVGVVVGRDDGHWLSDTPRCRHADCRSAGPWPTGAAAALTSGRTTFPFAVTAELSTARPASRPGVGSAQESLLWRYSVLPTISSIMSAAARRVPRCSTLSSEIRLSSHASRALTSACR